jgi:hypothetical protein
MITQDVFIVHPTSEQANALKAFIKVIKIKFDIAKSDILYKPAIVTKIKKSRTQFKQGKFVTVKKDELQNLLEL